MHERQDSLYWSLLYGLVSICQYELIYMSRENQEAWLQPPGLQRNEIIRLRRHDLDWSRWIRNDLEQMRRQELGRKKKIYNVYVSQYAPVDDWHEDLERSNASTPIQTVLFLENNEDTHIAYMRSTLRMEQEEIQAVLALQREDAEVLRLRFQYFVAAKRKQQQRILNYAQPIYTRIFALLQTFMFAVLEWYGGSTNITTLLAFGAKSNELILQGQWWRFFTPMFLHIGLLHLLMNTIALYYIGSQVERIMGNSRFLFVYLFAGFCGTVLSFVASDSISAGASGAIFGCFGALLYIASAYVKVFSKTMLQSVLTLIGINLLFGFAVPGIDNAGHIGGLIGGFLAAVIVNIPSKQTSALVRVGAALLSVVIVTALLVARFTG